MMKKLTSLTSPTKFTTWVCCRFCCTISNAVCAPKNPQNNTVFDPKMKHMKNDLFPYSLIKVLDTSHDLNSPLRVSKCALLDSLEKQFSNTADNYCNVILKKSLSGNLDEMVKFCEELVKCEGGGEVLGRVLDVFVSDGRLDEAMKVLFVMISSRVKVSLEKWNRVLSAFVEGERGLVDVVSVYKEMVKSGTLPDAETLNCLIKVLFDAGMVDKAIDQFKGMKKKRCVPNCRTFEIVVIGLLRCNRVGESVCVMNDMFKDGVQPDSSFCNKVIPILAKENELERVIRLFELMKSSHFELGLSTYEAVIKCLCLKLRVSEAIALSDQMKNSGFSISADVLVDLLTVCCKLGKLDEGRSLLDDNQVLDPSLYEIMLRGYCNAHRFLAAKDLLQKMLLLNIADKLSINIVIQGLCNLKFVKQAREVLGKMIVSSIEPDSITYSTLITGKCCLGEYEDAMDLFRQVKENNWVWDPDSYSKLIKGLCKVEKFQEAAEVFICISVRNSTFNLQPALFSSLIKGFCATSRVVEAIEVFKFGQYHGNHATTSAYTDIMECLLKHNRPYDSLLVLPQILTRGLVLDSKAYCIVIQCMIVLRRTNYCILFLNKIVDKHLVPDPETLASLLTHFAYHSKLHTIWVSIDTLCRESEVINSDVYNFLISGLYKEGCKTEARQLLDYMLEKGWVPDATTHGLLIGSSSTLRELQTTERDNFDMQDEVSSILSDALGEM